MISKLQTIAIVAFMAVLSLLLPTAAHAGPSLCDAVSGNLVANCGFETGDFSGWTLTGNSGFISITTNANSGNFAANFGAVGSPTFLTQTQNLTTTAGDTYNLSFFLQNDFGCAPGQCEFNVSWNGVQIFLDPTPTSFGYTQFTFSGLLATSNSTALQFSFQQNPSFYQFDDVVVTQGFAVAAEPSSILLLTINLLAAVVIGLGWKLRSVSFSP